MSIEKRIGIEDARKSLGDLITAVQQRADIVLTRNGKPAARIVRYKEPDMTVTLANGDNETMTIEVNGDEVRQIFTTDGLVVSDAVAYAGPEAEEWVRQRLIEYRADGWYAARPDGGAQADAMGTQPSLSETTRLAVAAFVDATIEREYGRGEVATARQDALTALTADLAGDRALADIQLRILTRNGLAVRICQCRQLHPHGCPHGSASGSIWCNRHYEADVPPLAGALLCGTCHVGEYPQEHPVQAMADAALAEAHLGYGPGGHEEIDAEFWRRFPELRARYADADALQHAYQEQWLDQHPDWNPATGELVPLHPDYRRLVDEYKAAVRSVAGLAADSMGPKGIDVDSAADDLGRCPANSDNWTDADEMRASGHPAAQDDDYQDPALTAALAADDYRSERERW